MGTAATPQSRHGSNTFMRFTFWGFDVMRKAPCCGFVSCSFFLFFLRRAAAFFKPPTLAVLFFHARMCSCSALCGARFAQRRCTRPNLTPSASYVGTLPPTHRTRFSWACRTTELLIFGRWAAYPWSCSWVCPFFPECLTTTRFAG